MLNSGFLFILYNIVQTCFYKISDAEFPCIINFGMLVMMPLMSTVLSKRTVNKVAITEKKTVTSTISRTLIT
jgi:hypothetical protein